MNSSEVIAAIIALGGVFVSTAVSLGIGLAVNKYNYRQLYAQTVSANRMEWINVWRENVSRFLACAELLHNHCHCHCETNNCENCLKIEKEMYEAKGMVVSRLNLDEEPHQTMLVRMNKFNCNCSDEDFARQREAILALARKILKPEWERVKKEAKGEGYGK